MRSKIIAWVLMAASTIIFLPAAGYAAAADRSNSVIAGESTPQIRVQVNRGRRNRGRDYRVRPRGWDQGRHRGWYHNRQRSRLVRQTYWYNGRQRIRWVRVRY